MRHAVILVQSSSFFQMEHRNVQLHNLPKCLAATRYWKEQMFMLRTTEVTRYYLMILICLYFSDHSFSLGHGQVN